VSPAPGPWSLALESGAGIGVFFSSYGKVRLSVERRFWDRLELGLASAADLGSHLTGVEASLRGGVLLHLPRRLEVLLAWRLGYAGFRVSMPATRFWTGSLLASLAGELRVALPRGLQLRFAPLVVTGYWNQLWGAVLEPTLAIAWRFGGA